MHKDPTPLQLLLKYTVNRHFPDIVTSPNLALTFLEKVMETQIDLIIDWMRVGFIHGVMNTDNVSIAGETIDYGPCAFMDEYDPSTVFSFIDKRGRYAYANQPAIAQWNISCLAKTLLPLIHQNHEAAAEIANELLSAFPSLYQEKWLEMMRSKLGILDKRDTDELLIYDLLDWMKTHNADYTNTFNHLTHETQPEYNIYHQESFKRWHERWTRRVFVDNDFSNEHILAMKKSNPVVIPRNHKVEQALVSAEKGDLELLHSLLKVIKDPYSDDHLTSTYQHPPTAQERIKNTFCGT